MKPKAEDTEVGNAEWVEEGLNSIPWRNDRWFNFYWMADVIVEREGVSRGVAERTLRALCATGDVRSVRCDPISPTAEEPEIIRPSEWVKDQVDLADDGWAIFVSSGDVQYWLDKQALAAGRPINAYALLGTSRQLVVGPDTATGLISALTVGAVATQGTADFNGEMLPWP